MSTENNNLPNILLVDDDDIDAQSVERAMKKMHIKNSLTRARDGLEALEILRAKEITTPFLILLDLNMPRMNGLEFLSTIRKEGPWPHAVVFVLTTSKADEDRSAAYDQHISGYILKEKLQNGFEDLVKLLDKYWQLVEFPDS